MTPDLVQQFGPRLVTALTVSLVFLALWVVHKERYLAAWAGAWAIWTIRYAYAIAGAPALPIVLGALAVATATVTLWGACALTRDRLPRVWIALAVIDLVVLIVESIARTPITIGGVAGITHWTLLAAGLVWSGVRFLRSTNVAGLERTVAGGGLVVLGLIQLESPWAPASLDAVNALASMAAQLSIAIGTLLAYFRRATLEAASLHRQLESALTTALSGYIPICMHCKAIRDESGTWEKLEQYISRRTTAMLSHGICETCLATHWGEH